MQNFILIYNNNVLQHQIIYIYIYFKILNLFIRISTFISSEEPISLSHFLFQTPISLPITVPISLSISNHTLQTV